MVDCAACGRTRLNLTSNDWAERDAGFCSLCGVYAGLECSTEVKGWIDSYVCKVCGSKLAGEDCLVWIGATAATFGIIGAVLVLFGASSSLVLAPYLGLGLIGICALVIWGLFYHAGRKRDRHRHNSVHYRARLRASSAKRG